MNYDLSKQIVFITGATSGFGWKIAEQAHANGAKVIITGRREEKLKELAAKLGENVYIAKLDVTDEKQIISTLNTLPKEFSDITILVNNAGLALGLEPAHKTSMSDWEQMVDTNIKGVLYCTRNILPGMVTRNKGHIFNLGSIAGTYPYPGGNVYGATKAFLKQFTLNLKADLLGTQIRVTNIEPGMAETEFSMVRFKGDKTQADNVYQGMTPLNADDIADIIMWSTTRPSHVNINSIEVMAVEQAFSPFAVHRK